MIAASSFSSPTLVYECDRFYLFCCVYLTLPDMQNRLLHGYCFRVATLLLGVEFAARLVF